MTKKYVKNPIVIEAFRLSDNVWPVWFTEAMDNGEVVVIDGIVKISTLEGDMIVGEGDYIIQGVEGEIYPCKPDIFEKSYSEVK